MKSDGIFTITDKKEKRFLRRKTAAFDLKTDHKEIRGLIQKMRTAMNTAQGVGLSANQIGLNLNMFVAQVPNPEGGSKFYALLNPKIEKASSLKTSEEEGCLSVPGVYGSVLRPERITISGFDKNGRPVKIKAWGLLSRVFQHEIDHLNGILFIDKAKELRKYENERKYEK